MKKNNWGRFITITSYTVKKPVDGLLLSNSIRSSVTGLAKTFANEYGAHGITVNNVCPGYTPPIGSANWKTPFPPAPASKRKKFTQVGRRKFPRAVWALPKNSRQW